MKLRGKVISALKVVTANESWKKLAEELGLEYQEAGKLDVQDLIHVDPGQMSEESYGEMEKDIADHEVKGDGYVVHGWNDHSGYKYWAKEAEDNPGGPDSWNYIQVQIVFEKGVDPLSLTPEQKDQIKEDIDDVEGHFAQWNNVS